MQNLYLYLMFLPVIVYFIVVKYVPMLGLAIAFKDYSFNYGIMESPWVGLKHFEILFNSPQTLQIIRNTLMLSVLSIVVGFPVPIIIAILLNEIGKVWFKKSVQTLIFLPHFFSWVIVGGFVIIMFSLESGVINKILMTFFGVSKPFLYDAPSWVAIFLGSGIWKESGFAAVIYLAALSGIDPSLYEAASIDGASKMKQIRHITLPGLKSIIILMLILSLGRVMEVGFDQVLVLQNSVVSNVSEVISTYIYKIGILKGYFSLSTAMGLFESAVGLVLILTANQIARRFDQGLW